MLGLICDRCGGVEGLPASLDWTTVRGLPGGERHLCAPCVAAVVTFVEGGNVEGSNADPADLPPLKSRDLRPDDTKPPWRGNHLKWKRVGP